MNAVIGREEGRFGCPSGPLQNVDIVPMATVADDNLLGMRPQLGGAAPEPGQHFHLRVTEHLDHPLLVPRQRCRRAGGRP
jgi:hypothetical protein